jgi:hypothetical protein
VFFIAPFHEKALVALHASDGEVGPVVWLNGLNEGFAMVHSCINSRERRSLAYTSRRKWSSSPTSLFILSDAASSSWCKMAQLSVRQLPNPDTIELTRLTII